LNKTKAMKSTFKDSMESIWTS